jgi:cell wall-associated NlpC family hydrolase
VNLAVALLVLGGGAAMIWAGVMDPPGGLITQMGRVLRGEPTQTKAGAGGAMGNIGGQWLEDGARSAAQSAFIVPAGPSGAAGTAGPVGAAYSNPSRAAIVREAQTWLGVPYMWGGKTRSGVDCSGLTWAVYRNAINMDIGTWTGPQMANGVSIPAGSEQPGDLVFWGAPPGSHVGLVLGAGQMIHAPHTGDVVRTAAYGPSVAAGPMSFRSYLGGAAASSSVSGMAT